MWLKSKLNSWFTKQFLRQTLKILEMQNLSFEIATQNYCVIYIPYFIPTVVHKTPIASQETIQRTFTTIWPTYSGDKNNLFKSLICPRNVMLLAQSSNVARSWDTLAKFATFLLKENLMTCETFETQCVGIFKREWDATSSKYITRCFNAFLKEYLNSGGNDSKFTLLMDFLSEFCCDLDVEWLFYFRLCFVCSLVFIYLINVVFLYKNVYFIVFTL